MIKNINSLLILGCGGHAKVARDVMKLTLPSCKIAYLDDNYKAIQGVSDQVLGPLSALSDPHIRSLWPVAFVAMGNAAIRKQWMHELLSNNYEVPTLFHPSAVVSMSSSIGQGSLINALTCIQPCCSIGTCSIVNTMASVDHDCVISDFCHIAPGSHIAGGVSVGTESFLGIGCSVKENLNIGKNVTIGAGAVVIHDVDDGLTMIGNPAKPIAI